MEYRREHFVSDDGSLRLTIDYDLCFYDQTGKQFVSTSFAHRARDFLVLEGKTPVGREHELKELLYRWHYVHRAVRNTFTVARCWD